MNRSNAQKSVVIEFAPHAMNRELPHDPPEPDLRHPDDVLPVRPVIPGIPRPPRRMNYRPDQFNVTVFHFDDHLSEDVTENTDVILMKSIEEPHRLDFDEFHQPDVLLFPIIMLMDRSHLGYDSPHPFALSLARKATVDEVEWLDQNMWPQYKPRPGTGIWYTTQSQDMFEDEDQEAMRRNFEPSQMMITDMHIHVLAADVDDFELYMDPEALRRRWFGF